MQGPQISNVFTMMHAASATLHPHPAVPLTAHALTPLTAPNTVAGPALGNLNASTLPIISTPTPTPPPPAAPTW